jgi:branched-chain amino acid transport system ATP-binding protein
MSMTPLLQVNALSVAFGGIQAVRDVSLEVGEGELVTLIGANGAGKTTTLKAITRTLSASRCSGSVHFAGSAIDSLAPHRLPQLGLAMVPEGRGVFHPHDHS